MVVGVKSIAIGAIALDYLAATLTVSTVSASAP